jgi:hypothetical protein
MRGRLTLALLVVLATAAAARADRLPAGSVRVLPPTAGSPATLTWKAAFQQPAAAELQAYNVDIARGFRFDPRAARGRCSIAQARSSSCPASSEIGAGSGRVTVLAPSAPRQEVALGIKFFITPPQHAGDIAGLVLATHEAGLGFDLVGRLVALPRGPYGLELRFANTAAELPAGITVQLHQVDVRFGTQRTVIRRGHATAYQLLTNPPVCRHRRWPFLLTVTYSTGTERYHADGACRSGR